MRLVSTTFGQLIPVKLFPVIEWGAESPFAHMHFEEETSPFGCLQGAELPPCSRLWIPEWAKQLSWNSQASGSGGQEISFVAVAPDSNGAASLIQKRRLVWRRCLWETVAIWQEEIPVAGSRRTRYIHLPAPRVFTYLQNSLASCSLTINIQMWNCRPERVENGNNSFVPFRKYSCSSRCITEGNSLGNERTTIAQPAYGKAYTRRGRCSLGCSELRPAVRHTEPI
jgi:hypothetical protein